MMKKGDLNLKNPSFFFLDLERRFLEKTLDRLKEFERMNKLEDFSNGEGIYMV